MATILTIGVEPATETFLEKKGFMLTSEASCSKGHLCDLTASGHYEVAILGGTSRLGPGAVSRLREQSIRIPTIQVLEGPRFGNSSWSRRCIEFLDAGGDNVIEGPSRPEEMAYAVSSVLRRSDSAADEAYLFELDGQSLHLNASRAQARVNGQQTEFTALELKFLLSLARRGSITSREALTADLHDGDRRHGNSIEVFATRIRLKLRNANTLLVTHRGAGYELAGRVA